MDIGSAKRGNVVLSMIKMRGDDSLVLAIAVAFFFLLRFGFVLRIFCSEWADEDFVLELPFLKLMA